MKVTAKKINNPKIREIVNNNIRNLLDSMGKHIFNPDIKIDTGNSLDHEIMKTKICYNLHKMGHTFVTESKLKNGNSIPDILLLDLEQPICYEIMCSETDESITEKKLKYLGIRIIKVKVKK